MKNVFLTLAAWGWCIPLHGFTIATLWGWFVVPVFAVPVLSVAQGAGLYVFWCHFKRPTKVDEAKSYFESLAKGVYSGTAQCGISLLVGAMMQFILRGMGVAA